MVARLEQIVSDNDILTLLLRRSFSSLFDIRGNIHEFRPAYSISA